MQKIYTKKKFGQNFLINKKIEKKIIKSINLEKDDILLEIGPGKGSLTKYLLNSNIQVYAVEIDKDLFLFLKKKFIKKKIKIYLLSIFDFPIKKIKNRKIRILGNLPYNISIPIFFYLINNINNIKDLNLMFQKEVALKLLAKPNTKNYNRLSIIAQIYFKIFFIVDIKPSYFKPEPKVNSTFLRFIPHKKYLSRIKNIQILKKIVKKLFLKRRKIIKNTLKIFFKENDLKNIGINLYKRPQEIKITEYIKISNMINNKE